jgi:inosine-uridine nucleoside N-ribohydrolase
VLGCVRLAAAGTVWIDTDVSIGSPIREVDDAYALVLAFHSPEIRIGGISTSFGNASRGYTTRVARELVRHFGGAANLRTDQVYPGAGSANDLGQRTEASEALARVLEKNRVTYVALGPLTNLATFLQLHPERAGQIERVIFVGGRAAGTTLAFGPASFRIHDANVFKDPVAAQRVLDSRIPMTLASVTAGANLSINKSDLQELERNGGAAEYLARRSKWWLWFWTNIAKTDGGPIFDALAVVIAAKPGLVSMASRYAEIDAGSIVLSPRRKAGMRAVQSCTGFAPKTKRLVLDRLERR